MVTGIEGNIVKNKLIKFAKTNYHSRYSKSIQTTFAQSLTETLFKYSVV